MFARLLCIVLASVAATVAGAQSAGRVVVPYPPGGLMDRMARVIGAKLAEATERSFVVENRGGAAGAIGSASVKGGPTDGSLLLIAPDSNISVYPATVTKAAYAPLEDFVAIAHTGDYRISLSVHPSVPVQDLKSFIAWTKSQPDAVGYGTAGAGTNLHFYGVLFAHVSGANMKHVPYRGSGPAVTDLIAGHIPAIMLAVRRQLAQLQAGPLPILCPTGLEPAACS